MSGQNGTDVLEICIQMYWSKGSLMRLQFHHPEMKNEYEKWTV